MLLIPLILIIGLAVAFTVCEIKASKGNTKVPPDVLLILGCRVRGNEAEETLMMRIEKAAEYLKAALSPLPSYLPYPAYIHKFCGHSYPTP